MTQITKGPNRNKRVPLTEGERQLLHEMYLHLGAWTHREAITKLGETRFKELLRQGVIGGQNTDIGVMYHLLALGRTSLFHTADRAASLVSQLDQAYVRLCMTEKKWEFTASTSPFHKGLADLFPGLHLHFQEGYTEFGSSLIGGKVTGGGYSSLAIRDLGTRMRSSALSRNFTVVIFTPSTQRGQQAAAPFSNFLKVVPLRPKTGDASKRFNPLPKHKSPTEPGPYLTQAKIKALQAKASPPLPDLTLEILGLAKADRIEAAHLALQKDRFISQAQLRTHFALSIYDLPDSLVSNAILRPNKNAYGMEVSELILAANRKVARLDDGSMNHLLLTAQMRHNLGHPPDDTWQLPGQIKRRHEEPDAVRVLEDGSMEAIEADAGEYKLTVGLRKLASFKDGGYERTHWGCISPTRVKNLTAQVHRELLPDFQTVQWWNLDTL